MGKKRTQKLEKRRIEQKEVFQVFQGKFLQLKALTYSGEASSHEQILIKQYILLKGSTSACMELGNWYKKRKQYQRAEKIFARAYIFSHLNKTAEQNRLFCEQRK